MTAFNIAARNSTPPSDATRGDVQHRGAEQRAQSSPPESAPAGAVRVLVPVDVTHPSAEKALRTGAWLASTSGGDLLALYVVAPTDLWDAPPADTMEESAARLVEQRRQQLEELLARLDLPVPATPLVEIADNGDIAGTIVLVAVAEEADVIVAATNQAFELKGVLLGSVTRRLVNVSPRPVLVVRP